MKGCKLFDVESRKNIYSQDVKFNENGNDSNDCEEKTPVPEVMIMSLMFTVTMLVK